MKTKLKIATSLTIVQALLMGTTIALAQNGRVVNDSWLNENYTKREVMVEVRDGEKIYTAIYEPTDEYLGRIGKQKSPIMLTLTPYSRKPYGLKPGETENGKIRGVYYSGLTGDMANYVADGYIIVVQNVRGKFLSTGTYENMRPYISGVDGAADTVVVDGKVQTDDATDVYDSVEWLLANTKNTGIVGVKGVSYGGFYTTMATLAKHPAIKAVSPQAPATDWYMGDDAHHNGALCLTDSYRFGGGFYREFRKPSPVGMSNLVKIKEDIYEYFRGKPMDELSAFFGDSLRFWSDMMKHPDRDQFWIDRDPSLHLIDIKIPMLVTGGFYDAEDCYGAFRTYYKMKELSPESELYLAAGPWYHGGWNNRTINHLSEAYFGEASGAWYQDCVEYPFFAYYLEGKGKAPAKVNVLPSSETMKSKMAGVNAATLTDSYDIWPPKDIKFSKLYFSGNGGLVMEGSGKPQKGSRRITSDPQNPVPYMNSKATSRDRAYMVADQTFASERKDVLTYRAETLTEELHLAGPVNVVIEMSVDGAEKLADADIIVKLIDVRPDGYQMLVRGDVMPVRYRGGFDKGEPVKSGKTVRVEFSMCDIDHIFMPGHQVMVQVQGSWFPLIAMNPQTWVENQNTATADAYKTSEITVKSAVSYLELPVLKK